MNSSSEAPTHCDGSIQPLSSTFAALDVSKRSLVRKPDRNIERSQVPRKLKEQSGAIRGCGRVPISENVSLTDSVDTAALVTAI